jgi:hypothetical protein
VASAKVDIQDNRIGTDKDGTKVATGSVNGTLPFGNVLDGIHLANVSGVTIGAAAQGGGPVSLDLAASLGNLISGNLGRGI